MRKEKIVAGILGLAMVLTLCGIGYAVWNAAHPKKTLKQSVKSVQVPETTGNSSLSVSDNAGLGGGLSGQSQSLGTIEQGGGTSPSQTQRKAEDFSVYEKYKDSKAALFGEIKAGTGAAVKSGSQVSIYYVGQLTDGTIFDQSAAAKAGEDPKPFEFTIGKSQVIPGMEQGIFGMKSGGTRRIVIPPGVGYGVKGQGPVPPNAVMIFDVQLLSVK